jgi:hypothetical protein
LPPVYQHIHEHGGFYLSGRRQRGNHSQIPTTGAGKDVSIGGSPSATAHRPPGRSWD